MKNFWHQLKNKTLMVKDWVVSIAIIASLFIGIPTVVVMIIGFLWVVFFKVIIAFFPGLGDLTTALTHFIEAKI